MLARRSVEWTCWNVLFLSCMASRRPLISIENCLHKLLPLFPSHPHCVMQAQAHDYNPWLDADGKLSVVHWKLQASTDDG